MACWSGLGRSVQLKPCWKDATSDQAHSATSSSGCTCPARSSPVVAGAGVGRRAGASRRVDRRWHCPARRPQHRTQSGSAARRARRGMAPAGAYLGPCGRNRRICRCGKPRARHRPRRLRQCRRAPRLATRLGLCVATAGTPVESRGAQPYTPRAWAGLLACGAGQGGDAALSGWRTRSVYERSQCKPESSSSAGGVARWRTGRARGLLDFRIRRCGRASGSRRTLSGEHTLLLTAYLSGISARSARPLRTGAARILFVLDSTAADTRRNAARRSTAGRTTRKTAGGRIVSSGSEEHRAACDRRVRDRRRTPRSEQWRMEWRSCLLRVPVAGLQCPG